jgi:hypothetical protein
LRVVSYSLFRSAASAYESERAGAGRGVFFRGYLPAVVRAHRSVYPDWEMRIHHDERVTEWGYFRVLERLRDRGALKLIPMGPVPTLCGGMLWRMVPTWDSGVEIVVCRDIDSLSTPRERRAVERWIAGGKPLHSMQDSESHSSCRIMGGMLGYRTDFMRSVYPTPDALQASMRASGIDFDKHGADQRFLVRDFDQYDKAGMLALDDRAALGPKDDPRDECGGGARHVGGAYHAGPVAKWYDENRPDKLILECEEGYQP